VATHEGLGLAVDLGAGVIALLSLATIALLMMQRKAGVPGEPASQ
jgi:hypothetical protein